MSYPISQHYLYCSLYHHHGCHFVGKSPLSCKLCLPNDNHVVPCHVKEELVLMDCSFSSLSHQQPQRRVPNPPRRTKPRILPFPNANGKAAATTTSPSLMLVNCRILPRRPCPVDPLNRNADNGHRNNNNAAPTTTTIRMDVVPQRNPIPKRLLRNHIHP